MTPLFFTACKLVIVSWLIACGAMMKPRAPVEQLPHGDAAWHTLVSRLLTKHHCQVKQLYCFYYKIFSLENILAFEREIHNGLMKMVILQSNGEDVILEEVRMS